MALKDLSTTAASNNAASPNGAPESTFTFSQINDTIRQTLAVIRTLAASDTIASSGTTDLGSKDNAFLTITGTTTITSFGTVSEGIYKFVTFADALTLTHNATSLILHGGANRTTAAGDTAMYKSLGSGNWREMFYQQMAAASSYQPLDATLTALAGLATGANKVPYSTGADTFGQLDFSTNTSLGTSDTTVSSQKAIKTYADTKDIATQVAPGTSGNVLTSNGSAWTSAAPTGILTASYTSSDTAITSAGTTTFTHSLGAIPKLISVFVVCQSAEGNYSIGDVVKWEADGDAANRGFQMIVTSTQIIVRVGSNVAPLSLLNATTGASFNATLANWKYRIVAFA